MPPTDTVRPSRVWYWYWASPRSLAMDWKAWDADNQFRLVLVSLEDTSRRISSISFLLTGLQT